MSTPWSMNGVFIAADGHRPRIDRYDLLADTIQTVVSLPLETEVACLAIYPPTGALVAGTRSGLIYIHPGNVRHDSENNGPLSCHHPFFQGSPVLALLWRDKDHLIAGDRAGRCLVWNRWERDRHRLLFAAEGGLIGLVQIEERLYGLSITGQCLVYDLAADTLLAVRNIPLPVGSEPASAFCYWPAARRLIYPAKGSGIVAYGPADDSINILAGSEGDRFVLTVLDDAVIGVGEQTVRIWDRSMAVEKVAKLSSVASSVVQAAGWVQGGRHLLVIRQTGQTDRYRINADLRLERIGQLPGDSYRRSLAPDAGLRRRLLLEDRRREAQTLAQEFQTRMRQTQGRGGDEPPARLIDLGYRSVALALSAQAARIRSDYLAELRHYISLSRIFDPKSGPIRLWHRNYAKILAALHQPEAAQEVYRRLPQVPESVILDLERRSRARALVHVVEGSLPLPLLWAAARLLARPFHGRYLLSRLPPLDGPPLELPPQDLFRQYHELARNEPNLMQLQNHQATWLDESRVRTVSLLIFSASPADDLASLEFSLVWEPPAGPTVIQPAVLFHVPKPAPSIPLVDHYVAIEEAWSRLQGPDRTRANAWLAQIAQKALGICQTLNRLKIAEHLYPE